MEFTQGSVKAASSVADAALMAAVNVGDEVAIGDALDAGANPNVVDSALWTPLMLAAFGGYLASVELLCARGACLDMANRRGATALYSAACFGQVAVVAHLAAAGADLNIASRNDGPPLVAALMAPYTPEKRAAAICLLEAGADVNIADSTGRTPIFFAVSRGDDELTERLLAMGANPNLTKGCYDLLTTAAARGNLRILLRLLACGADASKVGHNWETALLVAAEGGHAEIVERLLEAGAALDHRGMNGRTALHLAVTRGHAEVARILAEAGADPDKADVGGETPRSLACRRAAEMGDERFTAIFPTQDNGSAPHPGR